MAASSRACQLVSSIMRCWGSSNWASRGDMRKKLRIKQIYVFDKGTELDGYVAWVRVRNIVPDSSDDRTWWSVNNRVLAGLKKSPKLCNGPAARKPTCHSDDSNRLLLV